MAVQPGLCRTWSETPKTGFLTMRLICWSDPQVFFLLFQVLLKEDRPEFPGSRSHFVHKLQFLQPDLLEGIPVYRVMNRKGEIIEEDQDPKVSWFLTKAFFCIQLTFGIILGLRGILRLVNHPSISFTKHQRKL